MSHGPEDTSTSGLGERRRRREAERARERGRQPTEHLTRRELRARDEALASGALTYGPEGLVPTSEFDRIEAESLSAASAAEPVSATSADEPLPGTRRARRAALRQGLAPGESGEPVEPVGSGESAESSAAASSAGTPPAGVPPAGVPRGGAATAGSPREHAPSPQGGLSPQSVSSPQRLPSPQSVPSVSSGGGPETALMTPVSRRSLRDKRATAPPLPSVGEPGPSRTGTGRRPVVRPPASVRATRGVSTSGELTDIQRAVREANTAAEGVPVVEQGEASSPTSWGSAVDIPLMGAEVSEHGADPSGDHRAAPTPSPASPSAPSPSPALAPVPASAPEAAPTPSPADATDSAPSATTPSAATSSTVSTEVNTELPTSHTPAPVAPSVPSDEDMADEGTFDLKPRWESVQTPATGFQAAGPQTSQRPEPPRRVSARGPDRDQVPPQVSPGPATDPDAELLEEEARKTPLWLFLLQMVVLVLVVAVLGVLVYLFATGDLFGENGTLAPAAAVWWDGPATTAAP